MKNIKRVPIAIIWIIFSIFAFTFVDYTWIFSTSGRFIFVLSIVLGCSLTTAMNADLKFWVYNK